MWIAAAVHMSIILKQHSSELDHEELFLTLAALIDVDDDWEDAPLEDRLMTFYKLGVVKQLTEKIFPETSQHCLACARPDIGELERFEYSISPIPPLWTPRNSQCEFWWYNWKISRTDPGVWCWNITVRGRYLLPRTLLAERYTLTCMVPHFLSNALNMIQGLSSSFLAHVQQPFITRHSCLRNAIH